MTIYKDECLPFESEDVLVFNDNSTIIDKVRFRISDFMHRSKSELKFDEAELEHLRMLDDDIII